MRSPSSPGWRTSVTYDSEEKLFFLSWVWRPAWVTVPALCRFWAEQRSDGKGRWVDASRQPSGGGQIFSHATWGRGSRPPPPHYGMPLSHGIRPCLHPAPGAASHSVFRVTDLISWVIFQAGHRWGIKLKTWLGMGHKGWILGASARDDMKKKMDTVDFI